MNHKKGMSGWALAALAVVLIMIYFILQQVLSVVK